MRGCDDVCSGRDAHEAGQNPIEGHGNIRLGGDEGVGQHGARGHPLKQPDKW